MSETNYLSVRVIREQPIPFNGEEVAPMFRACIVEQRAFLTGDKFVEVASLAYERIEAEAKRKGAMVLRQWANALEFVDHSGGDPKLCSYCGHPMNSSTCQRSHP
jgi:hypothetical protein